MVVYQRAYINLYTISSICSDSIIVFLVIKLQSITVNEFHALYTPLKGYYSGFIYYVHSVLSTLYLLLCRQQQTLQGHIFHYCQACYVQSFTFNLWNNYPWCGSECGVFLLFSSLVLWAFACFLDWIGSCRTHCCSTCKFLVGWDYRSFL